MKIADIKNRVAEIKAKAEAGDFESAHGLEDDLYKEVLQAVASGRHNQHALRNMAITALEAANVSYTRVTA